MLDTRTSQTTLENTLRDTILYALGRRHPVVSSIAALRAVVTRGAGSSALNEDDLIAVVSGPDTTSFRWSVISTETDNGTSVIKPNDVAGSGRWKSWTSPLRFSPVVGGNASYLHELSSGPVQRVIIVDNSHGEDEINALILGQVPSVLIEATDDDPEDATQETGHRWFTNFEFTISVVTENLRDRREGSQNSAVSTDVDPGANSIDGFIKALLGGTQLFSVVDGIRNIRIGRGHNWISNFNQRRVIRSRVYVVQATEENPNAPNDYGLAEEVDVQAEMTNLNDQPVFDVGNYVVSGVTVPTGSGLMKFVAAGSTVIAGAAVTYAGQLVTLPAWSDIYRDLLPNGTMTFVSVAEESEAPAVTATALRIGVCRTDGSGVLTDRYIAATKTPYLNPFQYPLS